jgi:vanillate O-demethylase monooxygenase subunit
MEARMAADKFLRNAWYVCAWKSEVGREPLARTICLEPVMIFRREDGTVVALEDRCCHRHLPLSKGRLIGDIVQCGYHGLEFDSTGQCVSVPGQTRVPPGARVGSYRVVDRHGLVWIWIGEADRADAASIPDYHWIDDPAWATVGGSIQLNAHYMLSIDNLLDLTHETYVHASTLGAPGISHAPIRTERFESAVRVTRWIRDEDPGPFWRGALGKPGNCDRWQIVNFYLPSHTMLDVGTAPAGTGAPDGDRSQAVEARVCITLTPIDEKSSWYHWAHARNFRRNDPATDRRFQDDIASAYMEDKAVLEAQQRSLDTAPADFAMIDVNADAGQLAGRRLFEAALTRQRADRPPLAAE